MLYIKRELFTSIEQPIAYQIRTISVYLTCLTCRQARVRLHSVSYDI